MSRQCPECFAVMTDADTFCGRCGHSFKTGPGANAQQQAPRVLSVRRRLRGKESGGRPSAQTVKRPGSEQPTARIQKQQDTQVTHRPPAGPAKPLQVTAGAHGPPSIISVTTGQTAIRRPGSLGPLIWLLPVFGAWMGGVIAWSLERERNPELATGLLVTGLATSLLIWLIFFIYVWS